MLLSSSEEESLRNKMVDWRWRLNHLYKIIDKNSNKITFKENIIQKKINDVTDPRKIVLKARQFGVTTNCVLREWDYTIFHKNVTTCILAHEQDAIKKIFRIVKRAYKFMPEVIKPKIDRGGGSKYEMFFPDINSLIYCDLESRGDTINRLHVSETSFVEKERLLATLQAVPINGRVTFETTANGVENFFYEIWTDTSQYSDYIRLFYPWFFNPDYFIDKDIELTKEENEFIVKVKDKYNLDIKKSQICYRRFKQSELKEKFLQEYPEDDITCFLFTGQAVVNQVLVKELMKESSHPIICENELSIFKKREARKHYVVGADPAQGIGGDYSVASVICVEDMEEVAFYRGQLKPFQFARQLAKICDMFSTGNKFPLLAVESNNHGHAVLLELIEHIAYPNLFYAKSDRPGWITDSVTRPIMMTQFIDFVENRHVKINSKDTFLELITLVNIKGKIQAIEGKHDDSVIATAIACQMLITQFDHIKLYNNISKAIIL